MDGLGVVGAWCGPPEVPRRGSPQESPRRHRWRWRPQSRPSHLRPHRLRRARAGEIPSFRLESNVLRFSADELEEWLEARRAV